MFLSHLSGSPQRVPTDAGVGGLVRFRTEYAETPDTLKSVPAKRTIVAHPVSPAPANDPVPVSPSAA